MKKTLQFNLLLLFGVFFASLTFGQKITGKVTSEKDGNSLPGVSVQLKGSKTGTSTDANGAYSIVATQGATLIFSYIGFETKEVNIGNRTILDISLSEDVSTLSEVVVTALGIKKDSKKLGYATSTVNAEALTENRQPNFMNALQGKVAGVNVQSLGTGPGGTSKIRIRGQSSISGQNSPLIVINGVPIDNTNFGTNPNNSGSDNSIGVRGGGMTSDGGDGLSSINPDDIESMTILKGATAAALYGSRAKDGVIMITTKTKGTGKGIGVTYNMNFTTEKALDFTDYQYEYGQGENGVRPTSANPTSGQWSFGEKFAPGMTQVLFDGVTVPYEPVRNRYDIFYRPGQNLTNTVSLSGGDAKGGFNLSFSNLDAKGIIPNNSFNRKTVNLGLSYDISKKLSFTTSLNYSNEYNKNPPNIANQDNSVPTSVAIMSNSMPWDLLDAKKYDAAGNEFVYSRFRNRTNPYFTLAEQFHNVRRDRIFGNMSAKYKITDWLSLQGRIGQDYWSRDEDYNNFPTGQASRGPAPAGFVNGVYTQEARRFREINKDLLLSASKVFGDFGLDVNLGGNQMSRRADLNSAQVTDFVVRDLYTIANGRVKDPYYDLQERAVNSVYGSAEVSYKNVLFVNGTLRNDWFSTLAPANRSILYPSISGSFVFSQAMDSPPSWLSFGKIRLAYAEVGSDTDVSPYSNNLFYGINANLFAGQPVGSSQGSTVPNANLRPMRSSEKEAGVELKFFNNRVGLDFATYEKITTDQIVSAQISDASGFTNTLINSGQSRTRGTEWLLSLNPVQTSNFRWDISFNGSYNKTKLLSLLTDTPGERITTGTHVFNGELRQVVGEELGQLYGFGFRRDAAGNKIFGANGIALRTPDLISFGSALPNWVGGITNSFTFKGISLSALIDFKLGGNMMSGSNFNMVRHGLHQMTVAGRDVGYIIGDGVNEKGEVNSAKAPVQAYWEVIRSQALIEPIIYNAGFWKLRQVTAGYDFTKFLPKNIPVNGVKLNLVANNVLMLKKWVPNIDPDSFGYTSDNIVGLESSGVPTTRSIGFNLNVKF
ncbi:SusC/RagA family TonB-linked outer membrane protein [Lacihabitans sp. LS3-19]|uniref:SusC/RagA family TonB-linked outer membrane protein n=1 Tax=Lacihabitans sp. LS3-19 TaxID=2487335 RepID=UPI0020CC96BC|nr:SusC/RagA family TonB-linked outer membrane protein [Lacihabitans sp. LS3-19]MCP9768372.1 SusC/RagA family TonB-linked outer membrane protein [Lacihabitans sp. LS3-19]